jgi:hypothetical protein
MIEMAWTLLPLDGIELKSALECNRFSAPSTAEIRGEVTMAAFQSIGDFFTRIFGWGGHSSGDERGPRPGDGAVIHHSSGEADFDGLSGDVPPPIKDANHDLPYPRKKSAD